MDELTRDAAQEAARAELSKPEYHRDDPSWFERAISWVFEHLARLLDSAAGLAPGGAIGMVALVVLLLLVVLVVRSRLGPLGRSARLAAADVLADATCSAAEHRARADAFAAEGRWAEAVRERLRAIVRLLEDGGVLEPRAGRTAAEVAEEAGAALGDPTAAAQLASATRTFDEIWYGKRAATAADDALLRATTTLVGRSA